MAGRAAILEDEEAVLNGRKVQPFPTPKAQERTKNDPESHGHTSFHDILGLKDLVSLQVWRASVAELLGSGILVFIRPTQIPLTSSCHSSYPVITFEAFLSGLVSFPAPPSTSSP